MSPDRSQLLGRTIRGLTLKQPWAWAISHCDKDWENRTWPPPAYMMNGYLAIHAGKGLDQDAAMAFVLGKYGALPMTMPHLRRGLVRGAIVAVAILHEHIAADTMLTIDNVWIDHALHNLKLRDVVRIEPVPCKGSQGLWRLPPTVLADVKAALRAAGRPA